MRLKRLEKVDVAEVIAAGKPWTDPEFPPSDSSLFYDWASVPSQELWGSFVWRRASDFYGPVGPFEDHIHPNDINQGFLGDCYLLGSASVLAEVPERVKELFPIKQHNAAGIYTVRLLWEGSWKTVVLDDYFPYYAPLEKPAFAHSDSQPELWVMLLEKAFAKLNGSYQAIIAGNPAETLRMLTGAPTDTYDATKMVGDEAVMARVFEGLLKAQTRGWPVMAATPAVASGDMQQSLGLVEGHAYGVLDARRVHTDDGAEHRLIQMRNPWGTLEWKGEWSEESSIWTDRLRKELRADTGDGAGDGVFWIRLEDVIPCLQSIYRNHWQPGWRFSSVKASMPPGKPPQAMVARLTVYDPEDGRSDPWTDLWLSLHCLYDAIETPPELRFTVLKKGRDGLFRQFSQSEFVRSASVSADLDAKPGDYLAVLRFLPPSSLADPDAEIVVDTYSERAVGLELVANEEAWAAIWPCLRSLTKEGEASSYEQWGARGIAAWQRQSTALGLVCMLYENSASSGFTLSEELSLQLSNLELLAGEGEKVVPAADQGTVALELHPGESRLLVCRQINANIGFTFGFSKQFSLAPL